MSILTNFLNACCQWLFLHWAQILISIGGVIAACVVYKLVAKQISRLKDAEKLEENVAYSLNRVLKWLLGLIVFALQLP